MADFDALIARAAKVRALYAEHETKTHGRAWAREELALGFVGDVGDLAKLVQAASAPSPTRKASSPTNSPTASGVS